MAALAVAAVLPLVPAQTRAIAPTSVPTFFTSKAIDSIPPGGVVLAYPYPDVVSNTIGLIFPTQSVMLDQAFANMRFTLLGGYGWFPPPTGRFGTTSPAILEPQSVQSLFDIAYTGGTPAQRALVRKSNVTADLRDFLRRYDVQAVIIVPVGGYPAALARDVKAAIGPPVETGGVTAWFHVQQRIAAVSR